MGRSEPAEQPCCAPVPARLTGSSAVRLHLTLVAGLTLCVGAFCIEVVRALGGNTLSWAYVVEWPLFAVFGTVMWWDILHGRDRRRSPSRRGAIENDDADDDDDLKAWRRYLREMEETDAEGRDA